MTFKLASKLTEVDTTFGPILAFENDFITNQILKFGAHTRPELAFLLNIVRSRDFVFDIGSHIGTFSVPLAQKLGEGGKLLAVEGKSESFSVLEKNLTNAKLSAETIALNALVVRSELRYEALLSDGNSGGTIFLPSNTAGVSTITTTIAELCDRYFMPRVIKIDIEGGEYFALRDLELLKREHPIIFSEVNGRLLNMQGASIAELSALFLDNGYRLFRNVGERNAAHDNFVVAEFSELPIGINNYDVLAVHQSDERLDQVIELLKR